MTVSSIPPQAGLALSGAVADRMAEAAQPWISYTPTVVGVTTSARSARYHRHGDKVTVEFAITLSAAPTAAVTLSLPSGINASAFFGFSTINIRGHVGGVRTAVSNNSGVIYLASATTVAFLTPGSAASNWAAGVPAAWASGDQWGGHFEYEAA